MMMRRLRQESGQTLVEFALTAVVSLTLLVFILDGSRILWNYITVSNAARLGARYAIVHGSKSLAPVGPGSFTALTNTVMSHSVGLDPANLTISPTWAPNNAPGSTVTVAVTYVVRPAARLFWPNQSLTLRANCRMVIQN